MGGLNSSLNINQRKRERREEGRRERERETFWLRFKRMKDEGEREMARRRLRDS